MPFGPQTARCAVDSVTGGGATGGSQGLFARPGAGEQRPAVGGGGEDRRQKPEDRLSQPGADRTYIR
jgi:hypothetical protein